MLRQLAAGHVSLADPKVAAVTLVSELRWTMLVSGHAQFVSSDRAVAMTDANLEFPWSGNAWNSSPTAQTTVPLGPQRCLVLEPGAAGIGEAHVDAAQVMHVNLRIYGWAERFIYGTTQAVVCQVRRPRLTPAW
jgi:hypothetical protein